MSLVLGFQFFDVTKYISMLQILMYLHDINVFNVFGKMWKFRMNTQGFFSILLNRWIGYNHPTLMSQI
jgi:hypothetical protein